jgi:uncharacterized protein YdeI (YjbR/CyaY-like superfamily)
MQAVYFPTPAEFREWLSRNAERTEFLWVGYYKVGSGKASMTWAQSMDEALYFGWIDGIRKSIDAQRYMIRFTPRKPLSVWSAVNQRTAELPEPYAAFPRRQAARGSEVDPDPSRALVKTGGCCAKNLVHHRRQPGLWC